jgi:hypothetical protein
VHQRGCHNTHVPQDREVPARDGDLLTCRGVPDTRGVVVGRRDDALPVGAEGGGPHAAFVPAQDRDLFAGGGVPDPRAVLSSDAVTMRFPSGPG